MELLDVLTPNGEFTGQTVERKEAHLSGVWHRGVVLGIISKDDNRVLLQKRSENKPFWAGLWDCAAGGHVLAGELGYEAIIRETQEELGITLTPHDFQYIGTTISDGNEGKYVVRHFNEYYIAHLDLDPSELTLQAEEVADVAWFDKADLLARIDHEYEGLTRKDSWWDYLRHYLER